MTIAAVLEGKGAAVESIAGEASLSDAVRKLGEKRIGALPVVEDGRIVGIVSERDVIYCLKDHGPDALHWPVARAMTSPLRSPNCARHRDTPSSAGRSAGNLTSHSS